jgi:hypothetical protein
MAQVIGLDRIAGEVICRHSLIGRGLSSPFPQSATAAGG